MMPAFLDDVIFPVTISRGSMGGPEWLVDIVEHVSGQEDRNAIWSSPLRTYDARWAVRNQAELYQILELYLVSMGPLKGFRMRDWSDFKSCAPHLSPTGKDQVLGVGDGSKIEFDLWKTYSVGPHEFKRRIHKPYGHFQIAIDGVHQKSGVSVDMATGVVTFDVAPSLGAELTWGGQFHVPVRFDSKLDQTTLNGPYGEIPSIVLKELRL